MNQLTQQTMTIKEFSNIMGTTEEAVRWHIRTLYPDLMRNGVQTRLNESQVTEIKKRMTATSGLVGAVTDLEMEERALSVMQWMNDRIQAQKLQIEEMKPKAEFYDLVSDSDRCSRIGDTAKMLNLTVGQNGFFKLLKDDHLIMPNNLPYQDQIDANHFKVVQKKIGSRVFSVALVTGKGFIFLGKRYKHLQKVEK